MDFSLLEQFGTFILDPIDFGKIEHLDAIFDAIEVKLFNFRVPQIQFLNKVFHDNLDNIDGIII